MNHVQIDLGDLFPDVALPELATGDRVSLRTLFDRPTCVFVWASW